MKSSSLNTGDRPSVSSVLNNPCFDSESQIAALEAQADDGISYLLPYVGKGAGCTARTYADSLRAVRSSHPGQRPREIGAGDPKI
jgi:hypothetical protein